LIRLSSRTSSSWEMSGWKGKEGGLAFAKDEHKVAWLREWHQRWSPTGRLTVLSLQLEEVPVAIEFFVRAGDGIFCFRGAYDDSYAKYGPGMMVFPDCMAYLLEHTDASWVDSATDKDKRVPAGDHARASLLVDAVHRCRGTLDKSVVRALPGMGPTCRHTASTSRTLDSVSFEDYHARRQLKWLF